MTAYQKVLLAYVNAIKERNNAMTEGDWYIANEKVEKIKRTINKLSFK